MKCKDCGTNVNMFGLVDGRCSTCHKEYVEKFVAQQHKTPEERAAARAEAQHEEERRQAIARMPITTDPNHKLRVVENIDIVTAEVVVGMNIFKDIFAGVRNVVGGRTHNLQKALRDIRKDALQELRQEATELGADAIVGVSLSYNEIGATGSTMLMLVASGTAVKLEGDAA